MSLIFNGTEVTDISMDGTNLDAVLFNGVCVFGECAFFKPGQSFNEQIILQYYGQNIYSFERGSMSNKPANAIEVQDSASPLPIYVWVDSHRMYWASEARVALLNKNASAMFYGGSSPFGFLTSIDLSDIFFNLVEYSLWMFHSCTQITQLDLSHWVSGDFKNSEKMFQDCSNLRTIVASDKLKFPAVTPTSNSDVFLNCSRLIGGNGTTYDLGRVDATYARIDAPGTPGYFTAAT